MRFKTREVKVGTMGVGANNPIRIQSMTTTPTRNVQATIAQIQRLHDEGCEIVRVTVQGIKEAESCCEIKNKLVQMGLNIPLVADIHFYPPAALRVVEYVDKVRINPGNFVDKRATFDIFEYDEATYNLEIEKIEEKFTPLVEKCKALNKALRIGTNHGSLSDRIMNRFGDTPKGMVESAFEFARICRKNDFHDLIFSMKASNPKVMIEAYRLLVSEMKKQTWDYPLHIGVTEAGMDEEGRIKSAVGIGTLLLEGLGDTIRVSLTEDPWCEIAPCKKLIHLAKNATSPRCGSAPHRKQHALVFLSKEEKENLTPPQNPVFIETEADFPKAKEAKDYLFLDPKENRLSFSHLFFKWLHENKIDTPVILAFSYALSEDDLIIHAAAEMGSFLIDGLGDGIWLRTPYDNRTLALNILQACRLRSFKTEFISCPSCGRTLFNLQDVTRKIQERTAHLPGVKIAIMGCIVNGPGEMADADFGYVGSKTGKIDLYVGKTCVEKDIPSADAEDHLISLIKKHNKWVEPENKEIP